MMNKMTEISAPTSADPVVSNEAVVSNLWLNNALRAEDFFAVPWRSFSSATLQSQKILGDAMAHEFQVMQTAMERLNGSYMGLLGCRQVQDLPAAWASLSASCCDVAAAQAKVGSTVVDQLRNCCAGLANSAKDKSDA